MGVAEKTHNLDKIIHVEPNRHPEVLDVNRFPLEVANHLVQGCTNTWVPKV